MTLVPATVRAGVFAAALAALLLAAPPLLPLPLLLAGTVLLSVLPALFPAGPGATLVMLAAAGGWLLTEPFSPLVLVLAALLYLLHSLSALAATLPYDAVVAPDVIVRWLLRTAAVIGSGALLSAAVLVAVAGFAGDRSHGAVTLAGLALALLLARAIVPRVTRESHDRRGIMDT
jgi:hypothetical protein